VKLAIRRMELKSAVRTLMVVMVDVLVEHPLDVTAAANNHPVQALTTGAPDQRSAWAFALGACRGV